MKIFDKVTDAWFFSETNNLLRFFHIYTRGDVFVMLPLLFFIALTAFFSLKFMLFETGILLLLRGTGEMVYWLMHQFGKKDYRPYSVFKNLSNNAVYVIYQLLGMVTAFVGGCLIGWTLWW